LLYRSLVVPSRVYNPLLAYGDYAKCLLWLRYAHGVATQYCSSG
jgi:hypothetical protein